MYLVTPESAGITADQIQELYERLKKRSVYIECKVMLDVQNF